MRHSNPKRRQNIPTEKAEENQCKDYSIFVGGLSSRCTKSDLFDYFKKFGNIVSCEPQMWKKSSMRCRGFALIQCGDQKTYDAILNAKKHYFQGRNIECKKCFKSKEKLNEYNKDLIQRKLFVGGLPPHATTSDLEALFKKIGEIDIAYIITHHRTGRSKGFGYVCFKEKSARDKAIAIKDFKMFGKTISCSEYSHKFLFTKKENNQAGMNYENYEEYHNDHNFEKYETGYQKTEYSNGNQRKKKYNHRQQHGDQFYMKRRRRFRSQKATENTQRREMERNDNVHRRYDRQERTSKMINQSSTDCSSISGSHRGRIINRGERLTQEKAMRKQINLGEKSECPSSELKSKPSSLNQGEINLFEDLEAHEYRSMDSTDSSNPSPSPYYTNTSPESHKGKKNQKFNFSGFQLFGSLNGHGLCKKYGLKA